MRGFAYDIHRYYPKNYFKYSQAPIIRIEYPLEVFPQRVTVEAEEENVVALRTKIMNNDFSDNLNYQVLTYQANRYKASVVDIDCHLPLVRLEIEANEVSRT